MESDVTKQQIQKMLADVQLQIEHDRWEDILTIIGNDFNYAEYKTFIFFILNSWYDEASEIPVKRFLSGCETGSTIIGKRFMDRAKTTAGYQVKNTCDFFMNCTWDAIEALNQGYPVYYVGEEGYVRGVFITLDKGKTIDDLKQMVYSSKSYKNSFDTFGYDLEKAKEIK